MSDIRLHSTAAQPRTAAAQPRSDRARTAWL